MSVFQSFALLLIGGFGAWIAFQQWRTARDKLRLDLFERRSAVVQALREFLRDVTPNGQPTADATIAFHEAIEQGRFLFGDELTGYLEEIRDAGDRLHWSMGQIANSEGDDRAKAIAQDHADREALRTVYKTMDSKFAPYLRFDHIRHAKDPDWLVVIRKRVFGTVARKPSLDK